jgi:hypothetical protein
MESLNFIVMCGFSWPETLKDLKSYFQSITCSSQRFPQWCDGSVEELFLCEERVSGSFCRQGQQRPFQKMWCAS